MTRARQRGAALILLLAILVLGAGWFTVTRLNSVQGDYTAATRTHNAAVLNRAKQALIAYVAMQAGIVNEPNPGAFPCPEAPLSFNSSSGNDGKSQPPCALPAVGRYPWRTIGTEKFVDAAGEPLWYVISPGWAQATSGGFTLINSNSAGQLTVDGVGAAVALIIAPGPPISAAAAPNCTAWNQTRPSAAPPDLRNYLECENANPSTNFVTRRPGASFNDQVVAITAAELLPALEAVIANRIEREVVPALKGVYASSTWATNLSAANPMYPYPAPFANPGATASYQGGSASCAANLCRGLFPVIFANQPADPLPNPPALCTPAAGSPCDPMFVRWTSGTIEVKSVDVGGQNYVPGNNIAGNGLNWAATVTNCPVSNVNGSTQLTCTAYVPGQSGQAATNVIYEVKGTALNVGMALRSFEPAPIIAGVTLQTPPTPTVAMNNLGSALTTFRGRTSAPTSSPTAPVSQCGLSGNTSGIVCRQVPINVPLEPLFPDHALANSRDASLGWFVRNEWYRVMYYAVAQGDTANSLPTAPACAPPNCITVANVTPAGRQRAILILAGRSVNGAPRPSAALGDYLEFGNVSGNFERQVVGVLPMNMYGDSGAANAYVIPADPVQVGAPLYFKAANANTGAATLSTAVTGAKNLLNADGSVLAAGAIPANGVVQVTWDGAQFLLSKRPFNDRIVVVDSN
jgi:hypothetical protein